MTMDQQLFQRLASELKVKVQTAIWPVIHSLSHDFEKELEMNCILSGGCFASLFHNEKVNDYDLWCRNYTGMPIIEEHLKTFKGVHDGTGIPIKNEHEKYNDNFVEGKIVTARATTLINKLQFIKDVKFDDAKKSFDYIHCTPHYDLSKDLLYISKAQLQSIEAKKLVVNNTEVLKEYRTNKFIQRGWKT